MKKAGVTGSQESKPSSVATACTSIPNDSATKSFVSLRYGSNAKPRGKSDYYTPVPRSDSKKQKSLIGSKR